MTQENFCGTTNNRLICKKKIKDMAEIIYIVTRSEEHSDYVEAAYRSREKAEEYCSQFNNDENSYRRDINEVELL